MSSWPLILAGDIGGTKTILGLYEVDRQARLAPIVEETYSSESHPDLESILESFRDTHPNPVAAASFAVAGPIREGRVEVTNLPWMIDAAAISERFGITRVLLLNDLEALASSVPHLPASALHTLSSGQPAPHGAIAVLAPGTGLGQAFLVWNGSEYSAYPSEGGHTDFAPATPQQVRLLEFMWKELGHVSVERVCSGSGLPDLYRFLRDRESMAEETSLADRIEHSEDPTPVIVTAAMKGESGLCVRTLELFTGILAAEAGNLALKTLSTGGLYLGGGIPPKLLPFIDSDRFRNALLAKGRFEGLLADMPIHVILDSHAVLHGAALRAR